MTEECEETTEEYQYKVGDRGDLKNGEDSYRILAIDLVVRPVGDTEFTISALVINNSHGNEGYVNINKGYVNIYEQSTAFSARGWSVCHALAGPLGDDFYDLTPPTLK